MDGKNEKPQFDALAGAPVEVEIGGIAYLVAKVSHADKVTLRAKLKSKLPSPMQMLQRLMSEPVWADFPEEDKKELRREAAQAQLRGEAVLSDDMVLDLLSSDPELTAFLAWLLIHKIQPDVNKGTLRQAVEKEGASEVLGKLLAASGLQEVEKN